MNRVDRLFAITLILQRKQRVRAQDLARTFEVSERTIYRDMTALSESGVPIVALPGEGYELAEGYFLRPITLTPEEARALFLAAQMLISHTTGRVPADAELALAKVAAVMPHELRAEVAALADIMGFIAPAQRFDLDEPRLARLQEAIRARRIIWIRYHGFASNDVSERQVEPHRLWYFQGAWYLDGFCRVRQDLRVFRLDRMDELKVLRTTFAPRQVERQPGRTIEARIRFAPATVRWVRERQHYAWVDEYTDAHGAVMIYRLDTLQEIKPWLLGWGAAAEPLAPPELREEIRAEANRILEILT